MTLNLPVTRALLAVSSNGRLYKLSPTNGATLAACGLGTASDLPLPPALISGRLFASLGRHVLALDPVSLRTNWLYDAGSTVHTSPAYSARHDCVVVCTADLYVHAIRHTDGARRCRVKPTVHTPGTPAWYQGGPVIYVTQPHQLREL